MWMARAISSLPVPVSPVMSTEASVGPTAHMVEHGGQRRAAADDLLEVVDGLDFFLQIEVLLLQAGLFTLSEHAIGNVDTDDRPASTRPSSPRLGSIHTVDP